MSDFLRAGEDIEQRRHAINTGKYVFLFIVLFSVLLAYSIPKNILSSLPSLKVYTDFMSYLIPSIEQVARWSIYPDVTRLFFSVMWCTIPIQAVMFFKVPGLFEIRLEVFRKNRFLITVGILTGFFIIPVFIFMIGGSPVENQGMMIHEVANRLLQGSLFWLGILGSCITIYVSLQIIIFIKWARLIPKIYF